MGEVDTDKYKRRVINPSKGKIIIHPIMRGGLVPQEVQKKLFEEDWVKVGYAICFDCIEGRSDVITKPPIRDFLEDVAKFFRGDVAEHTFGCRAAQFAVFKTVAEYLESGGSKEYAKVAITDPLCHYTTVIAAEMTGFQLVEPPHSGYPEYRVKAEDFLKKIEEVKKETGRLPGLVAVTHVEPYYGNVNPVKEVGDVVKEYDIPYMVNAAYSGGVMPIDMRDFKADFLTISAHKSMASLGPLGFLVVNYEWAKRAFKGSTLIASWSARSFGKKLLNLFGCSIGATPLVSSMLSFPYVVERVGGWSGEVEKMRWFVKEIENLGNIMLLGERPHRHHLMHLETPIFWEISKLHKRRGFFLADEMIKRGIIGLHKGKSKDIKLSLYGLTWDEVKKVKEAFYDIAERYIKQFKLGYEAKTP